MYDVVIIGAGPCGLACALSARKKGKSVVIVECGREYEKRKCMVDGGNECLECNPCNVMSGFGGCIHWGDSAKLSYYPSGRELYKKLGEEYDKLRERACSFWKVNESEFTFNAIETKDYGFEVKPYPVRIINSDEIKDFLSSIKKEIEKEGIKYINGEMVKFDNLNQKINVFLKDERVIECRSLVLAIGRKGIRWMSEFATAKCIKTTPPVPAVGVRVELPQEYLSKMGKKHPDFKMRSVMNGFKYKSFCFCGGENGGRIKYINYGDYTLLDGHVLSSKDISNGYGNFALLKQLIKAGTDSKSCNSKLLEIIERYKAMGGKPICQEYLDFKSSLLSPWITGVSVKCTKPGEVFKLMGDDLGDFCNVLERIFKYIAEINGVTENEIQSKAKVVGLELENMWNTIELDEQFRIPNTNVYVGGDCSGVAQGILQATMMGLKIANSL